MPDVRAFMASGYFNGKIYLVGGYTTGNIEPGVSPDLGVRPGTQHLRHQASMPATLGGAGSGVINGHLYVAGGRDANNTVSQHVLRLRHCGRHLDGASQSAQRRQRAGLGGHRGQALDIRRWQSFPIWAPCLYRQQRLERGKALPRIHRHPGVYDPATYAWSGGPSLNHPRSFPAGTACG